MKQENFPVVMRREKAQPTREAERTEGLRECGPVRISDEGSVMGLERRDWYCRTIVKV